MASIRVPAIRNIFCRYTLPSRHTQRRWAQVHDVRFLATHQPNHIEQRYRDKLSQKAKEEGHESISSLKDAYKEKIQAVRAAEAPEFPIPPPAPENAPADVSPIAQATKKSPSPSSSSSSSTPGIKPLSAYLDIPKILTLPPKEIETLWRLRHASNPLSICATIPLETYNRIASTARQNPQFILPLPREIEAPPSPDASSSTEAPTPEKSTAAEIHFLQWGFHPPATSSTSAPPPPQREGEQQQSTANTHTSTVIFTNLASFKLHGAYAQPHTIITHHLDLVDEKGLVLMNGTVVSDRGVSTDEAKLLIMWLQRFYDWGVDGSSGGKKGEMLRMFSKGDVEGFKIEELVEEVEKV